MLGVVPRSVQDVPPDAGHPVSAPPIVEPVTPFGVVLPAVGLEAELHLRPGEIDAADKALAVINGVLPHRLWDIHASELWHQGPLENACRRQVKKFRIIQEMAQHPCPSTTMAPEPREVGVQDRERYASVAQRMIQGGLNTRLTFDCAQINRRSPNRGYWDPIHHRRIRGMKSSGPMEEDPIRPTVRASRHGHLHTSGDRAVQTPQGSCGSVGRGTAAPQGGGHQAPSPRSWDSHQSIRLGLNRFPATGRKPHVNRARREADGQCLGAADQPVLGREVIGASELGVLLRGIHTGKHSTARRAGVWHDSQLLSFPEPKTAGGG
jgi:hypothetical protein